ncbi:PARP-type domain-containing protein [Caenorhabditis elegans]|uniref:PARP-type domain-containing protein n=1 Tax=Caenorhabditis elegans TaxID=6239 RepID=Q6EUT5_CAEEL|nr:PARP-type domain-containing protein [Caenorhabditis elegans]CAH04763.1 PARP-type domain-containing protein [Caenorhabditis elegans]|eukprot:NP_507882.2 Uncharacterized protein CELE_Y113G7A.12 [Caenorhabditis elegans]
MVKNGSRAMHLKCLKSLNCPKAVAGRLANNEERRELKRQREAGMIVDEPKTKHKMTLRSAAKVSQARQRRNVRASSSSSRESVMHDLQSSVQQSRNVRASSSSSRESVMHDRGCYEAYIIERKESGQDDFVAI